MSLTIDNNTAVMSFDPGVTTGLAIYRGGIESIVTGELKTLAEVIYILKAFIEPDLVSKTSGRVVVLEDLVGGGYKTKEYKTTCEIIGFIKGFCLLNNVNLVVHVPQHRIPFVAESMRYFQNKSNHEIDAIAHLLAYLESIK